MYQWIGLLILVVIVLAWLFLFRAGPAVPPLQIDENDPLMREAMAKAKASLDQFRALLAQSGHNGQVKVAFVSNAGATEYLWAEVLALRDSDVDVRYLTPPVTHTGRLERLHTHPTSDIVDWVVELASGKKAGGFTMRVMFLRGREQWGSLPPMLEAEEKKYEPISGDI